MIISIHAAKRMNQRGITKEIIGVVLAFGDMDGNATTLSEVKAARLLAELQRLVRIFKKSLSRAETARLNPEVERLVKIFKKVLDKGGVTVVSDYSVTLDETIIITAYNCTAQKRKKWQKKRNKAWRANNSESAFGFFRKRRS